MEIGFRGSVVSQRERPCRSAIRPVTGDSFPPSAVPLLPTLDRGVPSRPSAVAIRPTPEHALST